MSHLKLIMNNKKKIYEKLKFTKYEDELLIELIKKYNKNWKLISIEMNNKTPKQCRNRWNLYLNPKINHNPLNELEIKCLIFWVEKVGTNWSTIVTLFPGRTSTILKNTFIKYCKHLNLNIKDFQLIKN